MTRRLPPPRWQTPMPAGVIGSWGPDVGAYTRAVLGFALDRHQQRALNRALAYDEAYRLVHGIYLYSTARQNGKTAGVRSLTGWALTNRDGPPWSYILGLAHDRKQAGIPYRAVLADLSPVARRLSTPARGGLALTRYLGIRSGMYGRHREYHTASREARDAIRGESVDLGLFDEVRTQRDMDTWAALEPTTTARPDPLIFATSTAGDERSLLLREWWERGVRIIDGAEPMGRFGMTWYAAPDDLAPDDPRAWAAANPAVAEGRLSLDIIRASYASLGPAAFRMERLNLWADAQDEWLPAGTWAATIGPQPAIDGRVVLGVEAVPSWRRATVTVSIPTADGAWTGVAGELDAARLQLSSVAPAALVELLGTVAAAWHPAAVVYSAAAAAGQHVEAWAESADIATMKLGARELRAASELFRSELIGRRLTHKDDPLLALQARRARPNRPIEGGDWYLSIRESTGDIDAIRAAAWASWAAISPVEPEEPPNIHV
jgi:hypothetical protein